MVVQHNLTAVNANRMLGLTTSSQAKSTERLSSGYKINRAADDAAGLAISEKMRKQVRGLTQAVANAQNGISAVQTAEGALSEVHDMLQRMNELATKSANGTNSSSDRSYIQSEVDALAKEIDRVSETTKFNEIYLLKGDASDETEKVAKYATTEGTEAKDAVDATATGATVDDQTKLNDHATSDITLTYNGTAYKWFNGSTEVNLADWGLSTGAPTNGDTITITKFEAAVSAQDGGTATVYTMTDPADDSTATAVSDIASLFDETGALKDDSTTLYRKKDDGTFEEIADPTNCEEIEFDEKAKALKFNLQVGADGDDENKIGVTIESMSSKSLGVAGDDEGTGVDVSTEDAASKAIGTIQVAIEKVSKQRSDIGAIQNRLEHTVNNLGNVVENTTSAESQIRDTDMATEMVKFANNNILAQAGQAMLAQANQGNQGVLSLLG